MYKHILLLIFTSSLSFAEEYPTVCLEQGGTCYKGSWLKSPSNNVTYATFQGIKYAQPPVGELRLNFSMILVDKYLYRHGRYDISHDYSVNFIQINWWTKPERIYNPIRAMGFLAMFTFQLDNTKR